MLSPFSVNAFVSLLRKIAEKAYKQGTRPYSLGWMAKLPSVSRWSRQIRDLVGCVASGADRPANRVLFGPSR